MADSIERGVVKYSSRDYQSILEDFRSVIPALTELWDADGDADPGIVLARYLASCADMLSLNLDIQANEVYAPTVSQRKNAEKLFALVGYDLGWYRAARTECTFTNTTDSAIRLDFGFNGANFCTLNAYTDITNAERVITYNILPMTSSYTGSAGSRYITTSDVNVFEEEDVVMLAPAGEEGSSCTRVAIEGELRSFNVKVDDVIKNNCIINLPSQHVDTTAVWIKAKGNMSDTNFLETRWRQVSSVAEFFTPEPLFTVTYDNYSNAQVQVSNYLKQLENYSSNWLIVYWIDCSGVVGCVGEDVLTNLIWAKANANSVVADSGDLSISNLANTVELPHTYAISGASPETAHEAYIKSRNYINTWDSLITLSDYNKFIQREPGVDAGIVIDCQKALEYNISVYKDATLTDAQKAKRYITSSDFPPGPDDFDWGAVLNLGFDPEDPNKFVFAANFKRYTAMTFCIHNDFKDSAFGRGQISTAYIQNTANFIRYKAPQQFLDRIVEDYRPLGAMSVDLQFGYTRLFNFTIIGQIYTKQPVSKSVASMIVNKAKEALALFYAPASRKYGELPTVMEIVKVISNCDDRVSYFDAGNTLVYAIEWLKCDIQFFNLLSFARYIPSVQGSETIIVSPSCLLNY